MSTIEKIDLYKVPPRWLFLKITTSDGVVGWGEPVIEGKADTVAAAVKEFKEVLIGRNPGHIEDIYQTLYRGSFYRGGPILMSAISGIEQALWDIKGKTLGVPVYELLGGPVRDKMKVYSWVGGDKPSELIEAIRQRQEAGFRHVKMNAVGNVEWLETPKQISNIVQKIADIREHLGWDVSIGLDFHGRVRKAMAKNLVKELEQVKPMFIEEPVLSEHLEALKVISRCTTAPIATGERLFGRSGFRSLLENGYADIIQPDLSHAGGIWETRKIAAIAEAYDVAIAPHCPLGPISFASALQLDFCSPNALIQETSLGIHYHDDSMDLLDYLANPEVFEVENGYIKRNNLPGLGIEIDEEKVKEAAQEGHDWHNPVWRHEDGSISEW
ncbi:galactonate dehydratase [Aliifodinibius salicampi]|uniref:Galactonate dehydratase n=1 Tax=Fodinibius salicampi TaxID=1920655 RepID=A0ABT3PVI8_9BACT|nr:galactonate dehydratase [Fodinibius salicampi]MCW9711875.1 galactonate dehydratase [Fodinibius salicampi]